MLIEISAEETELLGAVAVFLSFLDRFFVSLVRTGFSFSPSLKISFHRLELEGGEEDDTAAVIKAGKGKGGSSSDSGTGSSCSSTCTSFVISGSRRVSGAEERVGRRMPLEKRSSAEGRTGMEVGTQREEEEGQKENSWEEAELEELRRGEIMVSSSSSFAIARAFRADQGRDGEMER
jgi:hypothetical protein